MLVKQSHYFCITIAYLRQVDLEEKASLQEKTAWEELQEGTEQAMAVSELLKKLDRPNEINLYYCGGLELLSLAIKDCKLTWFIQSPLFFLIRCCFLFFIFFNCHRTPAVFVEWTNVYASVEPQICVKYAFGLPSDVPATRVIFLALRIDTEGRGVRNFVQKAHWFYCAVHLQFMMSKLILMISHKGQTQSYHKHKLKAFRPSLWTRALPFSLCLLNSDPVPDQRRLW